MRGSVDVTDASILSVGSCVPNTKRVSSLRNDRTAPVVLTEVANGLRWRTAVCANKCSACGAYFLSYFKKIIGFQIDPIAATRRITSGWLQSLRGIMASCLQMLKRTLSASNTLTLQTTFERMFAPLYNIAGYITAMTSTRNVLARGQLGLHNNKRTSSRAIIRSETLATVSRLSSGHREMTFPFLRRAAK